jgi:thiol-disulfide isomerase/thioredoxin
MKIILTIIQFIGLSICLNGQTKVIGNFQSMDGWSNEIYLLAIANYTDVFSSTNKYNIDTAFVDKKGNFEFQLKNIPCAKCLYRIDVRPKESSGAMIFNGTSKENFALFELKENQTIKIVGNANQLTKSFTLEGESQNWSYEEIRKLREPIYELGDRLSNQFTNPEFLKGKNIDSLREVAIKQLIEISEKNNEDLLRLMKQSSNIYDKIVGSKLYDYDMKMDNDIVIYELMSSQLKDAYSSHPFLIQLNEDIYETNFVLPKGSIAPSLNLPDVEGKNTELHKIGTNLILVDFWASWCSPCRHENRVTVKPLYEKYKEKGFVVYSVSMDDKKEKWIKAIEIDEMDWLNVSDLIGSNSPVYTTYKIDGLPTTYLIEKEGFKIIAKNIRGEELKKIVEEYYKK